MASLKFASRIVAPGLSAFILACLGPNPLLDGGGTDTDTDGDPTTGDGDGDGDGEPTTGDGDGEPASCSNTELDGDETDVDCGGSCGPCGDGSTCAEQTDCISQVCATTMCQAPSCDDDVQNGDEIGIDCGGACKFCEYSSLVTEFDDFEGSAATKPRPAMFADASFALTYSGPTDARARWFDEFGAPLGPSIELSAAVDYASGAASPVYPGEGDDHPIHVLETGTNGMSYELFLIRLTQVGGGNPFYVAPVPPWYVQHDLVVDGSIATIAWESLATDVFIRRYDYDKDIEGGWSDVMALPVDPDYANADGDSVASARNADGVVVIAWVRDDNQIAVRRFDSSWVDDTPTLTPNVPSPYPIDLRVAIADDGRVAVLYRTVGLDESGFGAWILDADLVPEGPTWTLQGLIGHGSVGIPYGDVEALADGSFAFAWPDNAQDRVHLRRFVSAELPKLADVGDESPWPTTIDPNDVSLDGVDGRLVVVWSAIVDGVRQVQGQVLSY